MALKLINGRDDIGNSPLHLACIYGNLPLAQTLIEKKAEISSKNDDNLSPLQECCKNNASEIAKLLLGKNPDKSEIQISRDLAAKYEAFEVLELLNEQQSKDSKKKTKSKFCALL